MTAQLLPEAQDALDLVNDVRAMILELHGSYATKSLKLTQALNQIAKDIQKQRFVNQTQMKMISKVRSEVGLLTMVE